MKFVKTTYLIACLFLIGFNSSGNAGMITGAVIFDTSFATENDQNVNTIMNNIINQSGLVTKYVSGVDDFGAFVKDTRHDWVANGNEWFSNNYTPGSSTPPGVSGSITFDLGQKYFIDSLALWNEDSHGIYNFNISISEDLSSWHVVPGQKMADDILKGQLIKNSDGSYLIDSSGNYVPDPTYNYLAQVFDFQPTFGQYVKIEVLDVSDNYPTSTGYSEGFDSDRRTYASIGEVAFSTTPVPEPATLLLFGTGLSALAALRRRKK